MLQDTPQKWGFDTCKSYGCMQSIFLFFPIKIQTTPNTILVPTQQRYQKMMDQIIVAMNTKSLRSLLKLSTR